MKNLINIQQELKAPKNQRNNFGGYQYRSCEDILEAVKPLLAKYNCCLNLKDEVVEIGSRIYVKAVVSLYDESGKLIMESSALAREADAKKGMDESQITGAASSYARKYALNGLFAIDDTKDADTMDNREQPKQAKPAPAKQSEFFDDYKQELMQADTIDRIDSIAEDARKNMSKLNWTREQMNEFANIIKNRKEFLQGKIDSEI